MPKPFTLKVVTANALIEGDVVYLTDDDRWTRSLGDAELLTDEAHADLRLLFGSAQTEAVVGVYLADVKDSPEGPQPVHFREDFRCTGPSNYNHGKQSELTNV